MNLIRVIFGPTASGKSSLAVGRCLALGDAIIINADAMQCYDALPILSAIPTQDEQRGVPHRLYGFLSATDTLNAAGWVAHAAREIEKAFANNQTPMIVGGTGFYIKALMEGLSPIPDIDPDIRAELMTQLEVKGLPALYMQLQTVDPVIAARLKPSDPQRIIRALEVYEGTGTPLSDWQDMPLEKPSHDWQFHVTQINPSKEKLEHNIRARLKNMMDAGALAEARALSDRIDAGEVPENAAITIAHGFEYFRAYFKDQITLEDALEKTAIETRQYTKRQRTWLRHQLRADEILD
ncbi:MAG TPA: tRNA (adenosine(37)-N6)-dimethylallyltransferase MiaA [Alphaproteobacteria bacterium]